MKQDIALVVSDAHLGAAPESSEKAFLSFLEYASEARDLVINGDLFDFWFEYNTVILREQFKPLRILADLVESGTRVRLVAGNHDAWAESFLSDEIGLELIPGPVRTTIGGRRAFLAHGDGLIPSEHSYRTVRRIIRSRPFRRLFRNVHPDHSAWAVRWVSRTRQHAAHALAAEERGGPDGPPPSHRTTSLDDYATRLLAESPELQLVVLGHSHQPVLKEVEPGRHYLNAGDWITHCTYGVVGAEGVELKRWNPR
ncbi:MAG: UDP-2,3-diacylglucosamine diphosphatase [Gemmatimonadota bacterium]